MNAQNMPQSLFLYMLQRGWDSAGTVVFPTVLTHLADGHCRVCQAYWVKFQLCLILTHPLTAKLQSPTLWVMNHPQRGEIKHVRFLTVFGPLLKTTTTNTLQLHSYPLKTNQT